MGFFDEDDDADLSFEESRRADVKAENQALLFNSVQDSLDAAIAKFGAASTEGGGGGAETVEPVEEVPTEVPATEVPGAESEGFDPSFGLSIRDPQEAAGGESIGPSPTTGFKVRDSIRGGIRGFGAELSDIADLLERMGQDAGYPGGVLSTFLESKRDPVTRQVPTLRDLFNAEAGEPKTVAGKVTQDVVGQITLIALPFKYLKVAGFFKLAARNVLLPATTFALSLGEEEGNLSNLATEEGEGTVFDNPLTRMLSLDADDSTFERTLKTFAEGAVFGLGGEAALAKVIQVFRGTRALLRTETEIVAAANRVGVGVDDVFMDSAGDVATLRAQVKMLEAADDTLKGAKQGVDDAAKVADDAAQQADEIAKFRGEESPSGASRGSTTVAEIDGTTTVTTTGDGAVAEVAVPDLAEPLRARVGTELEEAVADLAAAEERLAIVAAETGSDGRVIEATRQALSEGGLAPKTNEALGNAATRNMPPPEPTPGIIDNFLEVNDADLVKIHEAILAGDPDDIALSLGPLFNRQNMSRILEKDGSERLYRIFGELFSSSDKSFQATRARSLAETGTLIDAASARAKSAGVSLEELVTSMEKSLPGRDLDVALGVMDGVLRAVNKEVWRLTQEMADPNTIVTNLQRAHRDSLVIFATNTHDRLQGSITEIARALSSRRSAVRPGSSEDILAAGRALRTADIDAEVLANGGALNSDKLTEIIMQSGDPEALIKNLQMARSKATLGDVLFNAFIANTLSGLGTHSINFRSNMSRALLVNPINKFAEQAVVAITTGDAAAMKVAVAHLEGMRAAARVAFKQNGSFHDGKVRIAYRQIARVTAPGQTRLIEDAPTSLLRSAAIGDLVRRGVPQHVPFSGGGANPRSFRTVGPGTLFPIPQRGLNKIGDYLEARQGFGAKFVDYTGRTMEVPIRGLVAADELATGINYTGQLYADTLEHVQRIGLKGEAAETMLVQLRNDVPNVDALLKRSNAFDTERQSYLKMLKRMDTEAQNYARRGTYTDLDSKAADTLMRFRRDFPASRWFAPFVRTPINLVRSSVRDFTPVGPLSDLHNLKGSGKQIEIAKAQGRLAVTAGLFATIDHEIRSGNLTYSGPSNPMERERWLRAGNVPDSYQNDLMRANDIAPLRLDREDPYFGMYILMANAYHIVGKIGEEPARELSKELAGAVAQMFKSKTMLKTMTQFATLLANPEHMGANAQDLLVSTVSSTAIPLSSFLRGVTQSGLPIPDSLDRLVEPKEDDTRVVMTFKDFIRGDDKRRQLQKEGGFVLQLGSQFQKTLPPGMSEIFTSLFQKIVDAELNDGKSETLNFFGDVITLPGSLGPDIANSFRGPDYSDNDPLANELDSIGLRGVSTTRRFGKVDGIILSPEQKNKFQRFFAVPKGGIPLREMFMGLIFNIDGTLKAEWENLSDSTSEILGGKARTINSIIAVRMAGAKALLFQWAEEHDKVLHTRMVQFITDKGTSITQEGMDKIVERDMADDLFRRFSSALDGEEDE